MNIYQTYKYDLFCIEVYISEPTFKKMVFKLMFKTANNKNNIKKITTVIQEKKRSEQPNIKNAHFLNF